MNLVVLRKKARLTQTELAQQIAVKQNTISMWETGHSEPDIKTIYKLAKELNCSTDDILNCFNKKATQ